MNDTPQSSRDSRRHFLKTSVTLAGSLLITVACPDAYPVAKTLGTSQPLSPNAFVRIDRDGTIALTMPAAEMGQGIFTGLAMVIAEELEVRLDQIRVEAAPADAEHFTNPRMGKQITAGSASMRGFWEPLRRACAGARAMLVLAARQNWPVA